MTVPTEPPPPTQPDVTVTSTERADDAVVLSVSGAVDYATAPQLREATLRALAEHPPLVVLDLLGVGFFGSAGLSLLLVTLQAAQPGTQVRVVAGHAVSRSVQLAGLASLVDTYATLAEALTGPTG